ncbi:cytochrome P450 [Trametes polyzona]|nr:cytochrome P450 [Trametes polyzona]
MLTPFMLLVAAAGFMFLLQRCRRPSKPLPPGPRALPLVGNLFDINFKEFWLRVASWSERYGDVVYLNIVGQGMLFLNSVGSTTDLLEKRGALYADRPPSTMILELCGCENIIAFARFGDATFRRQHRLLHCAMTPTSVQSYYHVMTTEVLRFLERMTQSPEHYMGHIRRFTGSQILSIAYGYKVVGDDDPFLQLADEAMHIISSKIISVGHVWLVDIFPILKGLPMWLPGAGFKRDAAIWKAKLVNCADKPFEWIKECLENGTAIPSYCATMLSEPEANRSAGGSDAEREHDIRWTANAMYIGTYALRCYMPHLTTVLLPQRVSIP